VITRLIDVMAVLILGLAGVVVMYGLLSACSRLELA